MRFGYVLLGLVTLTSLHISSGQCSNGLVGVQNEDICCDADCGTCGGHDCDQQTGGANACCTGRISDSGEICSDTMAAPCIIDDEEEPGDLTKVPETTCSNGLLGVQGSSVCCAAFCGTCGGRGCANIPNGEDNCCMGNIRASGRLCSDTMAAPCLVDDEVPEICSNGVPGIQQGVLCCPASCGICGGVGCATRPGGEDTCCTGRIEASGIFCSDFPVAPCIMD